MKIKYRTTRKFIQLKVDEIDATIFWKDKKEVEELKNNLTEILEDIDYYLHKF